MLDKYSEFTFYFYFMDVRIHVNIFRVKIFLHQELQETRLILINTHNILHLYYKIYLSKV